MTTAPPPGQSNVLPVLPVGGVGNYGYAHLGDEMTTVLLCSDESYLRSDVKFGMVLEAGTGSMNDDGDNDVGLLVMVPPTPQRSKRKKQSVTTARQEPTEVKMVLGEHDTVANGPDCTQERSG